MITALAVLTTSTLTFWLGYRLGHQMGVTEPIRRRLREIRKQGHARDDVSGVGEHSGFTGN